MSFGLEDLWIKCDDFIGFEGGGNKMWKFEFFVGEVFVEDVDIFVIVGVL